MREEPHLAAAATDGRAATWLAAAVLAAFPTVGLLAKHGMSAAAIALSVLLAFGVLLRHRTPGRSVGDLWPGWDLALPALGLLAVHLLDLVIAPACPPCAAGWPRAAGAVAILLPLAACGWVAATSLDRRTARTALIAGVVVAAAVAAIELGLDAPIYRFFDGRPAESLVSHARYNRGLVALVLLAIVAVAVLWTAGRRWLAAGLLAAIAGVVALGDSQSAQLCVAVAVLALAATAVAERLARIALVLVLAVHVLAAPWTAPAAYDWVDARALDLNPSVRHRLELWDHGAALAVARPWTGWGFDAFDSVPIAPERLARAERMTKPESHPHNAALQLWVESGIVGALLGLAFVGAIARRIGRLPVPLRPWATTLLAVALVPVSTAFGIWQVTYLAMVALAAFAFSLLGERRQAVAASIASHSAR